MQPEHKKRRSQSQRRHSRLLHVSRRNPTMYRAATLEDMSETVDQYSERMRRAEVDVNQSEKGLARAQRQVGFPSAIERAAS